MRALPTATVLLALGLLVATCGAALVQRQDAGVALSAAAPPATLAPGSTGSTVLGLSQTSATTTRSSLPLAAQQVLAIQRGPLDSDVRLQVVSATGFGALDSLTVQLARGGTAQTQAVVTLGLVTQATGVTVPLLSGGDVSVLVSGSKVSFGTATLVLRIVLEPVGGDAPQTWYAYTLRLT